MNWYALVQRNQQSGPLQFWSDESSARALAQLGRPYDWILFVYLNNQWVVHGYTL